MPALNTLTTSSLTQDGNNGALQLPPDSHGDEDYAYAWALSSLGCNSPASSSACLRHFSQDVMVLESGLTASCFFWSRS